MSELFRPFTNLFKNSQTLTFSLIPQGKTREHIGSFLAHDQQRADAYKQVKLFLDNAHKLLLENTLSAIPSRIQGLPAKQYAKYESQKVIADGNINWLYLHDILLNTKKDKESKDAAKEICLVYCELLADLFTQDENYEDLVKNATPDKYFKKVLLKDSIPEADQQAALDTFAKFACYFTGFQENRRNIYSSKAQKTAAPNRAIFDNFPKFRQCIKMFDHIKACYPEILANATTELRDILNGKKLDQVFAIAAYSDALSQTGIDKFNLILGGKSLENGQKIRGINEFINLYRQQHDEARQDRNLSPMPLLFKQILSDKITASFIPDMFKDDNDMLDCLKNFVDIRIEQYQKDSTHLCNLVDEFNNCLKKISIDEGIFVQSEELTELSVRLCGSWRAIQDAMGKWADEHFKTKKEREKWLKQSTYSLEELSRLNLTRQDPQDENQVLPVDILSFWKGEKAQKAFAKYCEARKTINDNLFNATNSLLENDRQQGIQYIKDFLDSIMGIMHLGKPLYVPEVLDYNAQFYSEFNTLYEALDTVVPLYNKIRNYLTKKVGDVKKIKLMFDNATLADGWDQNKEKDNTAIILRKDEKYYLGIMNPKKKTDFAKLASRKPQPGEACYQKMIYKYLPGPNKMLPHVFFSTKGQKTFKPSAELLKKYEDKQHIKSSKTFTLEFLHQLIDFFKDSIAIHPDWKNFGFRFSPTGTYQGIDEFYREISEQGFTISFCDIPQKNIDTLVDEGKLYLFQIYNKDFAEGSHGTPNKFTLYWKWLFSPENLAKTILKLNGEAELFWRKTAIAKPFVHKTNEKMVNRTYQDGTDAMGNPMIKHMSEKAHGELFRHVNGQLATLTDPEAKHLYESGKIVIKDVTHDIIKDRRYTQEAFSFHVPITINYKAADAPRKFNDTVIDFLRTNPSVNILGIDRGERNLLYYSLIDQQGNILSQGSLNNISTRENDSVNYHALLDQREKERADARKSWDEIGKIKDLKAGYMSQVIHKIAKLMVENNAIVVLEDLNVGFKRGRFAIEKQVYQNFEKALITKLNYLVFKDIANPTEPGGVLNGYQLTDKFDSFEKMGKQTGFLFYVPAAYTSKIDPTTGFVNLFDPKQCTNVESRKLFFCTFDAIRYDAPRQAFAFSFDYGKFKTAITDWKKKWTVYSAKKRYVFIPLEKRSANGTSKIQEMVNPTKIICEALRKQGIDLKDGFDLKAYLAQLDANRTTSEFFSEIYRAFALTLQMRNSCTETGEDFINSPVLNKDGKFFDSSETGTDSPCDADANGAYHIALKGLYLLQKKFTNEKPDLLIKHPDWLEFVQSRNA
ncbi:MAG: type V CRISPR-associated protein Cas12a/Cpf1 [Lentisphaeria bacterium]|nr:type V CRISPR-associated protein Cas12a/Cpf1 [Lentisphaeria bacterium]